MTSLSAREEVARDEVPRDKEEVTRDREMPTVVTVSTVAGSSMAKGAKQDASE